MYRESLEKYHGGDLSRVTVTILYQACRKSHVGGDEKPPTIPQRSSMPLFLRFVTKKMSHNSTKKNFVKMVDGTLCEIHFHLRCTLTSIPRLLPCVGTLHIYSIERLQRRDASAGGAAVLRQATGTDVGLRQR